MYLVCLIFQELRSEIELEVLGDTENLQLSFTTLCSDGAVQPGLKQCTNVKVGDTVSPQLLFVVYYNK